MIKYLNYLLCLVAIIFSVYLVITRDNQIGLVLKDLSIIFTITSPFIIEKVFNIKMDNKMKFVIILFIFAAHFLGATAEVYNKISWYDKFVHTLSGCLTAYLSLFLLFLLNKYNSYDRKYNVIFMIMFSLAIAASWEMFEYTANILFGGDAQRVALTGVNDTMQDIIVAFLGSILVSILYAFNYKNSIFDFSTSIKK